MLNNVLLLIVNGKQLYKHMRLIPYYSQIFRRYRQNSSFFSSKDIHPTSCASCSTFPCTFCACPQLVLNRIFCSCVKTPRQKMDDGRDDTKSPPMKSQKTFKVTDAKTLDKKVIASGKWIALNSITYQDPMGNKRTWESMERTTKPKESSCDAVIIIPTLKRMYKYDCIILVKQFRPPLGCCTLEFPAGLIDKGEDMTTTAIRELKEETGYTGQVKHVSPGTSLDGGTSNSTVSIASVEIDGDQKINKRPAQENAETEYIEVLRVQTDELLDTLNAQTKEGIVVDARVYSYAIALAHASKRPVEERCDQLPK